MTLLNDQSPNQVQMLRSGHLLRSLHLSDLISRFITLSVQLAVSQCVNPGFNGHAKAAHAALHSVSDASFKLLEQSMHQSIIRCNNDGW